MNCQLPLRLLLIILSLSLATACGSSSKAEVKKVQVNGVELAYYTRGEGEPLLMIMGFRGTMAIWDPALLNLLEKKYKLILFDNRGVGFSTDTKEDSTTISQMAKDAASLIQALGYKKVHVLGWSMGSEIAMELSYKFPEVVETVVLCSPNPGGKHAAARKGEAFADLTASEITPQKALELIFPVTPEGKAAAKSFVDRLTKAVLEKTVPDDLTISKETIERQVRALKQWQQPDNNFYDNLSKIQTPTLVTGGLADVLDSPDNVRTIANQIPFAWAAYFPGAGHDFHSQYYGPFAQLIEVFIETNKARSDFKK